MIQAMYSGIAGMKAFKGSLDVIGNNIANINTTAFKGARSNFKDMLSQTIKSATAPGGGMGGSNASQVGLGVVLASVDVNTTQGSMQPTGRATDLAVDGNGFFVLGGGNRVSYTRDGSFALDAEFNLTASGSGMKVMGWAADPTTGIIDTSTPINSRSELKIPVGGLSVARATTKVDVAGNLNASSAGPRQTTKIAVAGNLDKTTGPEGTTFAKITGSLNKDAAVGSTRDVNLTVHDQAGNPHDVTATFTKTAANTWDYVITAPGADPASIPGAGTISFDAAGLSGTASIPLNLTWGTGAITASLNTSALTEGVSSNAIVAPADVDGYAPNNPITITKPVYDSLGNAHDVTVTLTKQPMANTWRYTISCPDAAASSIPAPADFTFTNGVSDLLEIPMSLMLTSPNGSVQPMNMRIDMSDLKLGDAASVAAFPAAMAPNGSAPGEPVPIKFDIYDSLGLTHEMQVVFKKTADPATWDYQVVCPDATADSLPAPGQITFNSLGYSQLPSIPYSLMLANPNGSASPLTGVINTQNISQLNGPTTVDLTYQDGLELGTLESYSIGQNGLITGVFTNGSNRALGQLALAQFNNPAGLGKAGNNVVNESPNSGAAKIGIPGDGGLGLINAGFLESSNVDLATEFASMIVSQRGFQATSKIISTSDDILQELVNLKR